VSRVRLQDVAALAGVSIKTVSNVVNGKGTITAETRSRVQHAVAELKYRPNVAAQHLRRGNSGMIAVALPELTQPYFAELAFELVRAAKRRQLTVLLNQTGGLADAERAISDGIDMPLMDGLIMSPLALTSADLWERIDDTPMVLLGEHLPQGPPVPNVGIDNAAAARTATEHLLAVGRRRIGAIGGDRQQAEGPPRETVSLRLDGYRSALEAAGIPFDPDLVKPVTEFHRSDGARAMAELLRLPEPPDAVFCFNDLLALGALRALRDHGLAAPADVAVIGIDDVEEGRFSSPSLSTVAPDKQAIAERAIDLLLAQAESPADEATNVVVGYRLIARESTGAMLPGDGARKDEGT
jgi:LacI family repressor for deo operon, udp, cdd, tsx, nupC, and nupG